MLLLRAMVSNMRTKLNALIAISLFTFFCAPAFADWQSTLEENFPFVQTFNNIDDWTPLANGDIINDAYMPIETATQSIGVWRYFSLWGSPSVTPGLGISSFSQTVNPWSESISKSLRVDLCGTRQGPSRLAADIRTTQYPDGFKWADGVRVFYAMYRPSAFWVTNPIGYYKEFVFNMECNTYSCSLMDGGGDNYAESPYFDYHHTHENGVNPAVLISNATGDTIAEPSPRTDMRIYNDQWIFVEFLYTPNTSSQMATISGWIYNSAGTLLDNFYDNISDSVFDETEWAASSVGYFDNAMLGGNTRSENCNDNQQMYFDDLIVDMDANGAIAPRYFALAASPDSTICYPDVDNDLYPGSGSETVETCSTNYYEASHFAAMTNDCDDTNASINPGATDSSCDGVDQDCSGSDNCPASSVKAAVQVSDRGMPVQVSAHGAAVQ